MLCSVVAYALGTVDKLNAVAWFAGFATLNVLGILVRCRWADQALWWLQVSPLTDGVP